MVGQGKSAAQCAQQWARVANPRLVKGAFSALELDRLVLAADELASADAAALPSFGALADRLGGHRSDVQTRYSWLKLQRSRAIPWTRSEDACVVQLVERVDERAPHSLSWCAVATAVSAQLHPRTALCCRDRVAFLLANPALFRAASLKHRAAPLPTMALFSMAPDPPLPASAQPWAPTPEQVAAARQRLAALGIAVPSLTPTTRASGSSSSARSSSDDLARPARRAKRNEIAPQPAAEPKRARTHEPAMALAALAAFAEDELLCDTGNDDNDLDEENDELDVESDNIPLSRLCAVMDLPLPPSLSARVRRLRPAGTALACDETLAGF